MDLGGRDEVEKQKEADEEQPQGLANYNEWNYDGANYKYYGGEWDGYWFGPLMKKEEDKEPMFKVVEPPRSKKSKNEREQAERGKRTQPPAWKMNEAKEQAIVQKMEEREEEKDRCISKEKAIMSVDTSDEYEYIRVEGMIDSGAFYTISPMELVGGNEAQKRKCQRVRNATAHATEQKWRTKDVPQSKENLTKSESEICVANRRRNEEDVDISTKSIRK